jgi:UDP-2,3-diacylglucosamine pyrophosphatase LpxH
MTGVHRLRPANYRAIFISDIHLGFTGCRADMLLDFLRSTHCDYLFLVGDIIDVWQMKKRLYWPQAHNDVIRTIMGKAKHGTRVIYVPGNHDEVLRDFDGTVLGNLEIHNEYIHTTNDGKRLLVTHGDQFDAVVLHSKTVAMVGSALYEMLLKLNRVVNYFRRKLGFSYWSLAAVLKHKVKQAVNFISNFEKVLAHEAKRQKVCGVISGHIHRAEMTYIDDVLYCNCGDWVESCTALAESRDGTLRVIRWAEESESLKQLPSTAAA